VRLFGFIEKKIPFPLWTKRRMFLAVRQEGQIQQLNVEYN
jgi:hypothetical protein